MAGGDEEKVDNQYKGYLGSQIVPADSIADDIRAALDNALKAHRAGAWISPAGDRFGIELAGRAKTLRHSGNDLVQDVRDRHRHQPEKVDKDDWRAKYYQLLRMPR